MPGVAAPVKQALERSRENGVVPFEPSDQGAPEPHLMELYEEVLDAYLAIGTLRGAAKQTGLPLYEVSKIAKTPWWREQVIERRDKERTENDRRMTTLLNLSFDELEDLLRHGEEKAVATKNGLEIVRTKLPALAVAKMIEVLFDRRQLLRGEPTGISAEGNKLSELANKLEELGRAQQARTIEAIPAGGGRREDGGRRESPEGAIEVEVKTYPLGGKDATK